MLLRVKKTNQIVDGQLVSFDNHTCFIYWEQSLNNGQGGWNRLRLKNFTPVIDKEASTEVKQDYVADRIKEYKMLFKLESEDVDDFLVLNKEERKEWWKENGARLTRKDYIEIINILLEGK